MVNNYLNIMDTLMLLSRYKFLFYTEERPSGFYFCIDMENSKGEKITVKSSDSLERAFNQLVINIMQRVL